MAEDRTFTDNPSESAADSSSPTIGFDLAVPDEDRYQLIREHARGGAGRISLAWDRRLGREVAVKEPLRAGQGTARLVREAIVTARLQHPAIVPVHDAAERPGGTPFYVMKLIEGRSLRDAIAAAPTFPQRLALLPTVIAVTDAIAYAHSKGVIHRDLKPHNVLVGEFGETALIDWGLATNLQSSDSSPGGTAPSLASLSEGGEATKTGAVLGTPAYMPPEQARGEKLDQRADVYALGAMVYHLLAGSPPYVAREGTTVIAQVVAGPPRPLLDAVPKVPPELTAIVAKAMARDREDRYPTAKQLAEDLKRYQTGRLVAAHEYSVGALLLRWLARHKGVVAVAAASVIILAFGGIVSVRRVLAERNRAQDQRAAAEDLVEFMLVDLKDRLAPLGKLDFLEGVAGRVVSYYDRLEGALGELHPVGQQRRGQAFTVLGDVLAFEGKDDEALAAYRHSLAIRQRLAERAPEDDDRAWDLVSTRVQLAKLQENLRYDGSSRVDLEAALEVARTHAQLASEPARWRIKEAAIMTALAGADENRGDFQRALAGLSMALTIEELAAAVQPDDGPLAEDRVYGHTQIAYTLEWLGKWSEALDHVVATERLARAFSERHPEDARWQVRLAGSLAASAQALAVQGSLDEAFRKQREGVQMLQNLHNRDPDNAAWQYHLGVAYSQTSHAKLGKGDYQ
jgi:tetratricopeptide (TPR) repeat protein